MSSQRPIENYDCFECGQSRVPNARHLCGGRNPRALTKGDRFSLCARPECDDPTGHFHQEDWTAWWGVLTVEQQQRLRAKAQWEQMSVSAVAIEWGVLS